MTGPRRALIVIDVQQHYFGAALAIEHPSRDRSVAQISKAVDAANEWDIPVVIVQHKLPQGARFSPRAPRVNSCTPRSLDERTGRSSASRSTSEASSPTPICRTGSEQKAPTRSRSPAT